MEEVEVLALALARAKLLLQALLLVLQLLWDLLLELGLRSQSAKGGK
jgi:hypothetical protein